MKELELCIVLFTSRWSVHNCIYQPVVHFVMSEQELLADDRHDIKFVTI